MAITSLVRYATEAAASLPSTVILRRLPMMSASCLRMAAGPGNKPSIERHATEQDVSTHHPAGCHPAGWRLLPVKPREPSAMDFAKIKEMDRSDTETLSLLRSAERIGFVFSGGSSRCAFQVGVIETLREIGVRPALCVGVSCGAWNAASVAAGTSHRLRHYWRAFMRMPPVDLGNLLREQTPFRYTEIHRRTFRRYVGNRLRAPEALPLFVGVTRLRDRVAVCLEARTVEDPLQLLLASNYLPPYYSRTPLIQGERYGDGGITNNFPYEKAFAEGCDV